jgi:asparagine synthase (glutamine-hydrolysing)
MCGIAGFAGRFDSALLDDMHRSLGHRGPDGHGAIVIEPPRSEGRLVGFAHRRLAIIDLSPDGRQPMTVRCNRCGVPHGENDPTSALWLTYNGELYNYLELRRELDSRGHRFHSRTDSEVLLHLYAEDGAAMLSRLNGIFAFALYDGRAAGQRGKMRSGDVLIARDGLGVKPLYHSSRPEGVLFASELKAILQCRSVSRALDPSAIQSQLAYLWTPAPTTMLKEVRKLLPGHAFVVRDGRVGDEWCHYDLPYGAEQLAGSEEQIAARLREELEAAVRRQMVADVPVGAFLSGGLDSSAVVAMMRRARPDYRPRCYSIGFRDASDTDGNPPDLPYARRVAAHLGVDLSVLEVEPDAIENLERMLFHLDEPQADPAPINALLIAERARADGIKVLLSGAGGDDLLTGYRRHYALTLERHWGWMPSIVRRAAARAARWGAEGGAGPFMHATAARRVTKAFAYADLPPDERIVSYFWWSSEALRRSLYGRDLAASVEGIGTAAPLLTSMGRLRGERDPLRRMLYLEAKHFLSDHNLNYTDKTGMAAGVEVRVPLLDQIFVDFAVRIPSSMKQRGPVGKAIFKRAMEPYLPRDVIYRPKTGFGAPLRRWIQNELRGRVDDTLSESSLRARGLFEPSAVRTLVARDRRGEVDASYTIFALLCMELWCRIFIDPPVPVAP